MKSPTIGFIADKAGVSKRVVSVVVNGIENKKIFVSQEKKRQILDLVEEYGYVPRKYARDLAGRKTDTVALIFHRLTPYFANLLEILQDEAYASGLEVMPYITKGSPEREESFLEQMRDGRVDGIIVSSSVEGSSGRLKKYSSPPYNLKIVAISGRRVKGVPTVNFDEIEAGRLAAEHLIGSGREKLCFFGGRADYPRAEGFREYALAETGQEPLIFTGETTCEFFAEAQTLAQKFAVLENLPEGIFASNDLIGAALAGELLRHGVKIPEDVSVVGCDNTEVCLYACPPLSSIDTNCREIAKIALAELRALIEGREERDSHKIVRPSLAARESSLPGLKLEGRGGCLCDYAGI